MKIKDISKVEIIKRNCSVCCGKIAVKLFGNGKYSGGNYFHSISECNPNGHCPDVYKKPASNSHQSKNECESWECDKCYNNWE